MGQQDFYKQILGKRKKGKTVSDRERNAVEELMELDGKIEAFTSEKAKIEEHTRWLQRRIKELEKAKQDILDSFATGQDGDKKG